MKFTVQKQDMVNKLASAMGSVSSKNNIPAIEGVLIETLESGLVQISTYDMNKGYRATLEPISIEREGKYIINAQRLYQTMRVLSDDEVTFDVNERLNCTITSGNSSFSMFALSGEEFPGFPDLVTERGFTVSSDVLKNMISKVAHSIAIDDIRPMLCGAFFKISKSGLEVVSCDSYTLSKCSMQCEIGSLAGDGSVDAAFIIPGHALGELSKMLSEGKDEPVKFYLSRKHAIVRKNDVIFFTRTIDSEYIDYERLIPRENDILVTVERERFLSGLERANIIAEEKIQGAGKSYVKISCERHYLTLASTSLNGAVSDEMDCTHEGDDIVIGFNCRYLINSVRAAEGDNILIKLKSPNQAITIEPAERDDKFSYFYMLLPVRMIEG